MNILLLNAGSSSLKCTLMEAANGRVIARALADWAGKVTHQYAGPVAGASTPRRSPGKDMPMPCDVSSAT